MFTTWITARGRCRFVVLSLAAGLAMAFAPTPALAVPAAPAAPAPSTAAEASARVAEAGQRLTEFDEQVHQAELTAEAQQQAAAAAAQAAAEAQAQLVLLEPQLRAIAKNGYSGNTQSRLAAFLTSESAGDLVQQLTTLDLLASHANTVVTEVAAANAAAVEAQAAADQAAAQAQAGLADLQTQRVDLEAQLADYQAEFERLSAADQVVVTTTLSGPTLEPPAAAPMVAAAPTEAAGVAIEAALAKVGSPYVYGASGPDTFDCSGLTMFAYAAAGVSLPHSSRAQAQVGTPVSRDELQPGDLVFFYSPISHVGLYIGNGMMVHARTFGQPVKVTSVDQRGYVKAVRPTG